MVKWNQLDLNLLRAFDALASEGNVTRAARRIGLSQSAFSHSLSRLRDALGDDLFIRTADGMVPTPRAEALAGPVHAALAGVASALAADQRFDPAVARRTFHVAASDYAELAVLPPLMARIAASAPHVDVVVRPLVDGADRQLETGGLDVLLDTIAHDAPNLHARTVLTERFVCVMRRGHPALARALSLDDYVALPHALVSPNGRRTGVVDTELAALGRQRRVACIVPHFLAAPHLIATTDMILTIGERIARAYAPACELAIVAPPLELPIFSLRLFWHQRTHHDAAGRWLRGMFVGDQGAEPPGAPRPGGAHRGR